MGYEVIDALLEITSAENEILSEEAGLNSEAPP